MDQDLLTEAARRAVEAATIIAVQNGEIECEPLHLLWALVLDESRASEVLREAGVNRERLRAVSPLVVEQDVPLDESAEDWPTVSQTEAFRRVIASATHRLNQHPMPPPVLRRPIEMRYRHSDDFGAPVVRCGPG